MVEIERVRCRDVQLSNRAKDKERKIDRGTVRGLIEKERGIVQKNIKRQREQVETLLGHRVE